MACEEHSAHTHKHGAGCGHLAISHEGHVDYLHDGHLHNVHGGHVDEHRVSTSSPNPSACTPSHQCTEHAPNHVHGPTCGHERVPHADHVDFVVGDHLHHPHGKHCDDHGAIRTV